MMLVMLACAGQAADPAGVGGSRRAAPRCGQAKTGATGPWLATHPATAAACGLLKIDSCAELCRKNHRCKAWQWMQPSPGSKGTADCYLKSEAGLAPNGASTAGEIIRPPPPSPPPPLPPPPPFATTATVATELERKIVLYGYGNELAFQSLNDSVLNAAIAASGAVIGRYPGGTPSDYWDWQSGWATDLKGYAGPRPATPTTWAEYTKATETTFSVFDTNQLTRNLSYAIAGLKAHEAAGQVIQYVELGNEMYDSSRSDVMAAYPNGSAYAAKMAEWTREIKAAFPQAHVALIGCRWNAYRKAREDDWNKQVLQNPISAQADAATFHIYCPFDENDNSSSPVNLGKHLAQAFFRVEQNKQHVAMTVPAQMALWVTEMGIYPAGPLLWTWLEALFYVLMDLLLPQIEQLEILTPYCLVCGDPTAPSFVTSARDAVVPPSQAGDVPWALSLKGHAQSIVFRAAKISGGGTMTPLSFDGNPVLDPSVASSRALVGWQFRMSTSSFVIVNAGAAGATVNLQHLLRSAATQSLDGRSGSATDESCSYYGSFPKALADLTRPGMMPTELGTLSGKCAGTLTLPAYGIVTIHS